MSDTPSFDQLQDDSQASTPIGSSSMKMPDAKPQDFDSMKPDTQSFDELKDDTEQQPKDTSQYGTSTQQGISALEGAARGATFGLSTKAETALGVDPEDIQGREEENPLIKIGSEIVGTVGSSLIPGVGEGWLLGKAAKAVVPIAEEAGAIAKVGRLALRGLIETTGMATGDEISDAFLDKQKSAAAVAGHIVGAGALGMLTGGAFGASGQGLEAIQNAKLGEYLDNFAIGLGAGSGGEAKVADLSKLYEEAGLPIPKGLVHGMKFYGTTSKEIAKYIADKATEGAAGLAGGTVGNVPGGIIAMEIARKYINPYSEALASKITPTITGKAAVPIMLKAIAAGETTGLTSLLDYGSKAAKGTRIINQAMDNLFKTGGEKVIDFEPTDKDRERLSKYIDMSGINQQMGQMQQQDNAPQFAEGGQVEPKPINQGSALSRLYPDQNMMVTAAKGRVSNYLNTLKPRQPINKKVFDPEHTNEPDKKNYERALDIANKPISVIKHIKDGTLLPAHVTHLKSMYPEVHDHLAKKITERLVKHQDEDSKPSKTIRNGLSLFLGAPLESNMTPMSIQAAQSVFLPKTPPQQPQQESKPKKSTAPLSKVSKDYQTSSQSRDARMNKS